MKVSRQVSERIGSNGPRAGSTHDPAFAAPLAVSETPVPGVNLAGFLAGELGLGEVARKLGKALEHAEIPFAAIPYLRTPTGQTQPLESEPAREAVYDTNIVCLNADYMHTFLEDVGVGFFTGRYTIGVCFWESNVFRAADLAGLRFVDEVWVASEYVRKAIAAATDVPVHVVRLPMEEPPPPRKTRAELGLPDAFTFLFVFDFVSAQRKNPLAVVAAFKRAFRPGEGPVLVMKGMNGRERKPQWLDELVAAAEGRSDIHVIDEYFPAEDRDALLAACDCYVSLHRSEGFGLTIAEAMAHGRPVIATGYSGNLDYMTDETGYLVPYRLVPVPEDWWAYAPGAEWAEAGLERAAAFMREVHDSQNESNARGASGRSEVLRRMSLERTSATIEARLSDIRERRHSSAWMEDPRVPIIHASRAIAGGVGASLDVGSRSPRLLRRFLMRALWPYLEEQHRLNATLLDGLATLERNVQELSRRLSELERRSSDGNGRR
jgi:glycosyltransferase involved in cell wall biosynthesis